MSRSHLFALKQLAGLSQAIARTPKQNKQGGTGEKEAQNEDTRKLYTFCSSENKPPNNEVNSSHVGQP